MIIDKAIKYFFKNGLAATVEKARGYFGAQYNMHLKDLSLSEREQIIWRSLVCAECAESQQCKAGCGCPAPDIFFIPGQCDGKEWPDLMDPETWDTYKKTHDIDIDTALWDEFESKAVTNV
jgi:hypothetical protein